MHGWIKRQVSWLPDLRLANQVGDYICGVSNLASSLLRSFSLESDEHCNKDYIEVRRGGPGGALLGRFCGTDLPNVITDTNLWVKFKSDEDSPGIGFSASYTSGGLEHNVSDR